MGAVREARRAGADGGGRRYWSCRGGQGRRLRAAWLWLDPGLGRRRGPFPLGLARRRIAVVGDASLRVRLRRGRKTTQTRAGKGRRQRRARQNPCGRPCHGRNCSEPHADNKLHQHRPRIHRLRKATNARFLTPRPNVHAKLARRSGIPARATLRRHQTPPLHRLHNVPLPWDQVTPSHRTISGPSSLSYRRAMNAPKHKHRTPDVSTHA